MNAALHSVAISFLNQLLNVGKGPEVAEYSNIIILRQWEHIDVLLLVNNDIAIIIEDKTGTKDPSDKLLRYRKAVKSKHPERQLVPVYFKTGDQCDYASAKEAGYGCFLRRDFLEILMGGIRSGVQNEIFSDFHRHLHQLEEAVNGFRTIPLQDWKPPQWRGFFMALTERLGEGDWDHRGHAGGGSYTLRWCQRDGKYLGLDGGALVFKIAVEEESQRKSRASAWRDRVIGAMKRLSNGITLKPFSFRVGHRMTVAELEGDYRAQRADGLLDLDATVETLHKAEALMTAALLEPIPTT